MSKHTAPAEVREWGYFIGGEFRTSGEPLEVRSPFDDSLVATTFWTPESEVEEAIRQAQTAFAEVARCPFTVERRSCGKCRRAWRPDGKN